MSVWGPISYALTFSSGNVFRNLPTSLKDAEGVPWPLEMSVRVVELREQVDVLSFFDIDGSTPRIVLSSLLGDKGIGLFSLLQCKVLQVCFPDICDVSSLRIPGPTMWLESADIAGIIRALVHSMEGTIQIFVSLYKGFYPFAGDETSGPPTPGVGPTSGPKPERPTLSSTSSPPRRSVQRGKPKSQASQKAKGTVASALAVQVTELTRAVERIAGDFAVLKRKLDEGVSSKSTPSELAGFSQLGVGDLTS